MAGNSSRTISLKFTGDIADLVAAAGGADAALKGVNNSASDTSGFDKLTNSVNKTSLVIAGLGAASALGGAALIAGVGLGAIGAAALLLDSNLQIKQAATDLTNNLKDEGTQAASGLVQPMVDSLHSLEGTVEIAKPQLNALFAGVKPDIPIITSGLDGMVTNLLPGLAT